MPRSNLTESLEHLEILAAIPAAMLRDPQPVGSL
jgi:hypothetical protein